MHGCKLLLALLVVAPAGFATSYAVSGNLGADDSFYLLRYTVQVAGTVTVTTTSYDNLNGFSPVLSLFDTNGAFKFSDNGRDNLPATGDASLQWFSDALSDYLIVVTEWDNVSFGPGFNFTDGFTEQGAGNFTAAPPFNVGCAGNAFLGDSCEQRSSAWAFTISAADPLGLQVTPEPSSGVFLISGIVLLAAWKRRTVTPHGA